MAGSVGLEKRGDLRGVGTMLVAVLAWSLVPLVFAVSGGLDSPFLFNAAWRIGVVLALRGFVRAVNFCLGWRG